MCEEIQGALDVFQGETKFFKEKIMVFRKLLLIRRKQNPV